MKYQLNEKQVDHIISLKWGKMVDDPSGPTFTSNKALAKIFGVSESKIRQVYMDRFEKIRNAKFPLIMRL